MDERRRQILSSLLQLAHADGLVVSEEQELLEKALENLGGSEADLHLAELTLPGPMVALERVLTEPQERREFIRLLVDLSMCDGNRSYTEAAYVAQMADRLAISSDELEQIQAQAELDKTRAELESIRSQADVALRQLQA